MTSEMQSGAGNRTRGESVPAIERSTGRPWAEWVAIFESQGARAMTHAEISRIARAAVPEDLQNPDWWAQGIAIAFEQHAGLRVPGQSSTGSFRVSASRTLAADRDEAVEAWASGPGGAATEHLGHGLAGEARRSRTEKRTFWRARLEGAGKVEVSAVAKDEDRIILAISHDDLPDGERIEEWRAHWKALLAEL